MREFLPHRLPLLKSPCAGYAPTTFFRTDFKIKNLLHKRSERGKREGRGREEDKKRKERGKEEERQRKGR
jgi:hypothetical protein